MTGSDKAAASDNAAAVDLLAQWLRTRLAAAQLAEQARLLSALLRDHGTPAPAPGTGATPPVLTHLADAVAAGRTALPVDVGDALAVAATGARWTRTAAYLERPPGPGFLDGYAHATLLGPADGTDAPGAPRGPAAALGLLLLGPGVAYPHHQHPADEVYLPLTPARWSHGAGDRLAEEPVGVLLHHRPWQAHAMATDDAPLLAVYLWTGDVLTPSAWC